MARFLVLGTGTEIGKTFVTALLARTLRQRCPGHPVSALKPIETGLPPSPSGQPAPQSDAALLEAASSDHPLPRPHPLYAFEPPISPHLAAERAGRDISLDAITAWTSQHETRLSEQVKPNYATTRHVVSGMAQPVVFVESAGGAFSPLAPGLTNFDLVAALEPDLLLLVAPDALGVLHDLSVCAATMSARGRAPDLVVLSQSRPPDASTGTNRHEAERLGIAAIDAVIARDQARVSDEVVDRLLLAAGLGQQT